MTVSPEGLLWLSGFFSGCCRLEEAVPKTCLALDDQREGNGEQQELEAGWPVQLQLESEEEVREGVGSVGGLCVMSGARWGVQIPSRGTLGKLGEGRNSAGPQGPG